MRAISSVTLPAGRMPPCPGLAPCESFSSIIRIESRATCSSNRFGSKPPSTSRHPKYPVPTCQIRSPPGSRWNGDNPPSPVLCANPPFRAPRLSARIALLDNEPKLIAEMLSSEAAYGCLQSGPPTVRRGGSSSGITGAIECAAHS